MKWNAPAAAFLSAAIMLVCGALSPAVVAAAEIAPPQAQLEAGRKIYNFRCYFCHGYSGDAQTVAANYLNPRPRDFTRVTDPSFSEERIVSVLKGGKPGTAMQSFRSVLSDAEMAQLAAFVMDEFVQRKALNTRYHTPENGWPDHEKHSAAFPFATGEIPNDRPLESLTDEQARGKRLFLSTCVVCHARNSATDGGITWEPTPLSFPRNNYSNSDPPPPPTDLDAMSSASPYLRHEIPPQLADASEQERKGEKLFQGNCAFCHGADGTGKNWIGSFLQPHPRNLRDPAFMKTMTRTRLASTIREGLPGTSMPAWKSVLGDDDIAAIVSYVSRAFHPLPE